MSRFENYFPADTQPRLDGDTRFIGVADKGEPDQLPPALLRRLTNGDCRDGTVRTRAGSQTPRSLLIPGTPVAAFGCGLFSDPLETEWLLVATADGIWRMRDGRAPRKIEIPEAITGRVVFAQAFRTVLVLRGPELAPWSWDGNPQNAFEAISQTEGVDFTSPIPNGPDPETHTGLRPVPLNNRLIVPHGRSQLAVSDLLDYTRYDRTFADFNVTGGNDDVMTALFRYNEGTLLIFNDQSVQRLSGIDVSLANLKLEPVNDSLGCLAGGSVARLGNDVLWLADDGVFQLAEVEQRRQTAPIALSDPILRTMQRIHWRAAKGAVAAVDGTTYYLAVPLDGSLVNNAILAYDSALGAWQGVHTFAPGTQIDALLRLDWFGRKRLHAVDLASGRTHLLYEGRFDYVGDERYAVALFGETRAYRLDTPDRKRFRRGRVYVRSWSPRTTLSLQTDGVKEAEVLALGETRNRTRHMTFGTANYLPSNVGDNHAAPHREDYSVDIGTPFNPGANGIDFELEQEHRRPFTLRQRGRHATLRFANGAGTLAITSVVLEGAETDRADRAAL